MRRVTASLVLLGLIAPLLGCASSDDDSGAGGGAGSSSSQSTAVCDTYCARAVEVCTMTLDGCVSACKSGLKGACAAEYRKVYDCWATAELTCSQFNVASSASCTDLSAEAGACDLADG